MESPYGPYIYCARFVRQKRGKKVPSFTKYKVAFFFRLFLPLKNPAQFCYLEGEPLEEAAVEAGSAGHGEDAVAGGGRRHVVQAAVGHRIGPAYGEFPYANSVATWPTFFPWQLT
jgi:hypothetical protein